MRAELEGRWSCERLGRSVERQQTAACGAAHVLCFAPLGSLRQQLAQSSDAVLVAVLVVLSPGPRPS